MLMDSFDHFDQKWLPAIAAVLIYPLWIWLAVSTKHCLQVISRHAIPYSKRTIWLIKIIALIIGAGGVLGVASTFGLPWFLAVLPAGFIVYFALKENVQDVIPPRPAQDGAAYQQAWSKYWRLRSVSQRSWRWFGAAFVMAIVLGRFAEKFSPAIQIIIVAFSVSIAIGSYIVLCLNQYNWMRWPCPRCGCSFRGVWGRPWLPKCCVYCGLPREEKEAKLLSS
jgi:hypothetical protein